MPGKAREAAKIGIAAYTAVLHKLASRGLEVLQPLGDHLRYDLAYYLQETYDSLARGLVKLSRDKQALAWSAENKDRT